MGWTPALQAGYSDRFDSDILHQFNRKGVGTMAKKHKYFRKLHYKQKLENMAGKNRTYFSRVYYLTKEPDPKNEQKDSNKWWYRGSEKVKGRNYSLYWDRPEVDYAIVEYVTSRRSKMNKFYKHRSNKKVRQDVETYNHGLYKKKFDIKWSLD